MKLALASTTVRSSSPSKSIEMGARLGYDAVEIWAELLWESGENPTAAGEKAKENGLALSIHGPIRDLNVTSVNRGIRRESRAQYEQAMEDAARMGAEIIVLHPGAISSSRDDPQDFIPLMIDYGKELAQAAERLGLVIGMEVMERRTKEYLTDIPSAAKVAREVGHPAFGLTVDLAHLLSSGVPLETKGHEDLIRHLHISGSTRKETHVPLAEGIYDLNEGLAHLRSFFNGIVAIEGYVKGKEVETATENKREFDRLMERLDNAPPDR